ncbi:sensor histidine kinase [Aneurinibacillus terranovensis]|uniref:sensor histidine kinase n=1 Tax=Aneurinibacillus terranovensis TaxID=278991 RepID=UPI0003FF64CA|nr:sensor histidine kinase [Aneurinibacillus terranovensis]
MKLNQKIWLIVSFGIIFTLLTTYSLTQYLYERLYVHDVETSLSYQGKKIAAEYKGGSLSPSFQQLVKKLDNLLQARILVTENPSELGACLPFDVDYNSLITANEREQLLAGRTVTKTGYEKRFDRQIMAVIVPLLDGKRLAGVVYMYLPLATITEAFSEVRYILLIAGTIFVGLSLYIGRQIVSRLTRPLQQMEHIAQQMAVGNFKEKMKVTSRDEIGNLSLAFNHMSAALEEVDHKRREFLANVSHELRTPLSYIKGYSEAMVEGIVVDEAQRLKYLQLIHRESGRMQCLVHDLLDLAQLEGESYPLQRMPLPVAQLIEDTLEHYKPILRDKHILLAVDINPDPVVNADENRLEQVIHNIMDNAIRHVGEGSHISVRLEEAKQTAVLTISDNGPGIPPEEVKRLGERFYRVDKARNRKNGGSGLGLSIVKQIVYLHGGQFTIKSVEGKGTDIIISLPLYEV